MAIYSPILTYFGAIIIIKENLYTYIHTYTHFLPRVDFYAMGTRDKKRTPPSE